ncbi:MAG: hypothetical protein ACUVQ7_01265 [bacterium]
MKAIAKFILLATLIQSSRLLSGDISASGGWTEVIDADDLVAGAGSNLIDQYQSAQDATTIDISNVEFYDVYVRKSDNNWNNDLILYIKRTGAGSGGGNISGGTTFQEVTGTDSKFFSGYLARTGITVQYKLTGMSISISPDAYSTSVILTVVDQGTLILESGRVK